MTVLAGPGGSGGGGLVAARHLANRGCAVQVVLAEPDRLTPVPAHQADILARMGVPIAGRPSAADLVLDALIGYSLRGDPAGTAAELITWANDQAAPVLALDTPSGLDLTTGAAGTPRRPGHGHPHPGPAQGRPARRAERRGTLPGRHLGAAAGLPADGYYRPGVVPPVRPAPDRSIAAIRPAAQERRW